MSPFPLLGDSDYAGYVGPLAHRGANTTTHLADIRYPVQTAPILSVVKLLPPTGLAACNEAIAWLFLRATSISSPRNAALLTLSEPRIKRALGVRALPAGLASKGLVVAWASAKLNLQSLHALFAGRKADERWLALLRTVSGAAVASFDEVFLNMDRNTGNVLFSGPDSCVPIDHELSFGTQDWRLGDLQHMAGADGDSVRRLKRARDGNQIPLAEYDAIMNRMVHAAREHQPALSACADSITDLLERVYPGAGRRHADRVLSFITERTAAQWIHDRLGVM